MKRLLIIDDNSALNFIITSIFKREKFAVDSVHKGKAGLELLMKNNYDVLITDMNLPDISGLDILNMIQDKKIVKIMIAAYCDSDLLTKLKSYNAKFVEKPFQNSELIRIVKENLN